MRLEVEQKTMIRASYGRHHPKQVDPAYEYRYVRLLLDKEVVALDKVVAMCTISKSSYFHSTAKGIP